MYMSSVFERPMKICPDTLITASAVLSLSSCEIFRQNLELEVRPRYQTRSPRKVPFRRNTLHLEVVALDQLDKHQFDDERRIKSTGASHKTSVQFRGKIADSCATG
jgi:hypothetical protein